jgi:hypothetical protein
MARKKPVDTPARLVRDVLGGYAERGVFRSFSGAETRGGKTTFTMVWHHGRQFRIVLDLAGRTVSFPELLSGVPARSPMLKALKAFLHQFETDEVPAHRRIDPAKTQLRISSRGGRVALGLAIKKGEFEYATRRLVHLAQEVFMIFLPDGPYYEYRVEHLGLDPEAVWA